MTLFCTPLPPPCYVTALAMGAAGEILEVQKTAGPELTHCVLEATSVGLKWLLFTSASQPVGHMGGQVCSRTDNHPATQRHEMEQSGQSVVGFKMEGLSANLIFFLLHFISDLWMFPITILNASWLSPQSFKAGHLKKLI